MPQRFDRDGIALTYPDNWQLDVEESDSGWTALFQSPDIAFVMVSLHPDIDDPAALAEGVLEAMREDYPQLEASMAVESLAGQPAIGHDIEFSALDLTNIARTRCVVAAQGSILFMMQTSDVDQGMHEPIMTAMQQSLTITDE